jgi:hypothetical protein
MVIDPDARTSVPARVDRKPLWRDLPILIAIIAGLFHFGRGVPVDGFVFVTIGIGLVIFELRDRYTPPELITRTVEPLSTSWFLLGAVVCLAYGAIVGQWNPASPGMIIAIVLPGLLILPLAWRVGPPHPAGGAGRGKWVWAGVLVLVCLWELISFLSQSDPQVDNYDHPTLSAIVNPLFSFSAVRMVVLVVWLAIGLWLARRLSGRPKEDG